MLYSRTSILQLTYGMYKTMGLLDCVCFDIPEYIRKAVEVGSSREMEARIRQTILQRKALIFESKQVINEWNEMLEKVAKLSPSEDDLIYGNNSDVAVEVPLSFFGTDQR